MKDNPVAKNAHKFNKRAAGPHKDKKRALKKGERKHKGSYESVEEKLSASDGVAAWIKDFQQSDAPQFAGKSAEKRKEMALAAYLDAKKGSKEEACWQGYTQKGMKKKGDRVVPNCVPEETVDEKTVGYFDRKKAMKDPKVSRRVAQVQKREKDRKAGMTSAERRALKKRQDAGVTRRFQSQMAKAMDEDLRKWFGKGKKGDWVRVGTDGEIKGQCAREPGEGKPKCMPRDKAHSMSKKDRGSSARRKRAKDPTVDRPGTGNKPIMVKTDKKESVQEKNEPTNPKLWAKFKAQAKAKFDVYPSAYANGWAAKQYKAAGGGWRTVKESAQDRLDRMAKKHGLGKPNKAADDYMAKMSNEGAELLKAVQQMKKGKYPTSRKPKVIPAPKSDMAKRMARGQRNDPVNKIGVKKESTAAYGKSQSNIRRKQKHAGMTSSDRNKMGKLADMMRKEREKKMRKEENIDELSVKTLNNYRRKASKPNPNDSVAKQDKRYSGVARAGRKLDKKLSGESVQNVQELSKKDMEMLAKRKQANLVRRGKAKPEPKKPAQKKPEAHMTTVSDKQGQDDNLIMQLRKAQDKKGKMKVKFRGGETELPLRLIDRLLATYDKAQRPQDKKKLVTMITHELRKKAGLKSTKKADATPPPRSYQPYIPHKDKNAAKKVGKTKIPAPGREKRSGKQLRSWD